MLISLQNNEKLYQLEEEVEVVKAVPHTKQHKVKEYQQAANHLEKATWVLKKLTQSSKNLNQLQTPHTKEELVAERASQVCVKIAPENILPPPLSTFGEFEV